MAKQPLALALRLSQQRAQLDGPASRKASQVATNLGLGAEDEHLSPLRVEPEVGPAIEPAPRAVEAVKLLHLVPRKDADVGVRVGARRDAWAANELENVRDRQIGL